ncbi:hypothetical protein CJF31_00005478 [Rutstroemia sp. NJR-2017a BVV2]|nr:hypothetical protein CJF31_00005478 [Rutstroemia sp. NJR-2017a BVV2]
MVGRVVEADTVPVRTEEDGYTRGVRDGRISALSHPIPEFEQNTSSTSITSLAALSELETLSHILTALEPTASNPNENDINSLSQQLQDQLTLTDENDDELKHAILWHLAYMEGMKDGCAMQAQLECAAIREDATVRKELMRRAVL